MSKARGIFTYVVGIASILALFIAIWSIFVTIDSVYGDADIHLKYSKGGDFNQDIDFFIFKDDSILIQFLIKNTGHGSTAVSIEPQLECSNCSFTISYNGEEFKTVGEEGKRPIDIHPVAPKSTEFIMIIFHNITREESGEIMSILARDLENNDHLWLNFRKLDEKLSELWFTVRSG
ncbi:hypothetical protein A3K72_00045 [Candidatus Woesearchaeota archaeon RBG_13_36_6]|nr:MAG: hypothetical protein A3K72_00045 [Candidatus Woesearchaeota archaeon RBG_13_36_6]